MNAFFTFVTHDWYFALPMGLMSVIGLSLVIWRLLLNYNGSVSMSEFLPAFQQRLEKEGVDGALRYCKERTEIIPTSSLRRRAWKRTNKDLPPFAGRWPTLLNWRLRLI